MSPTAAAAAVRCDAVAAANNGVFFVGRIWLCLLFVCERGWAPFLTSPLTWNRPPGTRKPASEANRPPQPAKSNPHSKLSHYCWRPSNNKHTTPPPPPPRALSGQHWRSTAFVERPAPSCLFAPTRIRTHERTRTQTVAAVFWMSLHLPILCRPSGARLVQTYTHTHT